MKITTEKFVTSFHRLDGCTIGERRKSLFTLLNNTQRNDHSEIDFNVIQPKTHLESIFKVDVMLYFQKVQELLNIFKSENPILIEKVLKTGVWFWDEAFKNITAQQFSHDILGGVSYVTKIKILNKLALHLNNSEKANNYYEAIKTKYGLYMAAKLIPGCTRQFILHSVEKDHIKLTEPALLLIIKKYPDITEDILFTLDNIGVGVSSSYECVFKYIARNNLKLFLVLNQKYKISFRLGWRSTQRYVCKNKEDIVKNADGYYGLMHKKQLVRALQGQFGEFYKNMFPKQFGDFKSYDFNNLLKIVRYLKKPDFNIILQTFKNLYGQELWDYPDLISLEFLEMVPSVIRETKLQREYKPRYMSDDKWMCYHETKVSIPYLKNRLSLSSDINSRADLVELLVLTCKINQDKAALAQLCQHMVNRQRNDNVSVRLSFLRTISNSFKLEELDEIHWNLINELIKIFTLKNESFHYASDFLEHYILYRLKHNLPIKDQLIEFCNLKCAKFNLFTDFPKFEKLCLLEFANIIPNLYKGNDLLLYNIKFLSALISYNQRHKHDPISIFSYPNAIESVKEFLNKKNHAYNTTSIIFYCIGQKKYNYDECNQLIKFFLDTSPDADISVLLYFIKKDPKIVQVYLEKITHLVLNHYLDNQFLYFWKCCRNYEHLEVPQIIVNICLGLVKEYQVDSGRSFQLRSAVHALSCLMPTHDYLQIISSHYPQEQKADAETRVGQKAYELQEYIGGSLKNLIPPSQALESILNFCKGDYLQLIQSSLYSVSCNTNENKLVPFFAKLINRAVSVRKHALHLTFHVLDKTEILNILDKFMKSEKNVSIRKFIFKHAFNFFIKNKDDCSWELVKLNISAVDVNDQEAFDILMQYNKIPKDYLDKYITFTWEFLEKLPDPENKIEAKKATLLGSIKDELIPALGKSFCHSLLEKYLFKFTSSERETRFQSAVQLFACKYIIYGEAAYVEPLFAILKEYINSTWYNKETEAKGCYYIQEFIETLCSEFLDNEEALKQKTVLTNFLNLWNAFLKPHEAFSEFLHLKLTVLYLERLTLNETVVQLAALTNTLTNLYGAFIMEHISEKIEDFTHYFAGSYEQEDIYNLIDNLVENNSTLPCIMLAIKLIDSNKVTNKTKQKYEKIVEILKSKNEPVIQIFLHSHFIKLRETS